MDYPTVLKEIIELQKKPISTKVLSIETYRKKFEELQKKYPNIRLPDFEEDDIEFIHKSYHDCMVAIEIQRKMKPLLKYVNILHQIVEYRLDTTYGESSSSD